MPGYSLYTTASVLPIAHDRNQMTKAGASTGGCLAVVLLCLAIQVGSSSSSSSSVMDLPAHAHAPLRTLTLRHDVHGLSRRLCLRGGEGGDGAEGEAGEGGTAGTDRCGIEVEEGPQQAQEEDMKDVFEDMPEAARSKFDYGAWCDGWWGHAYVAWYSFWFHCPANEINTIL